MHDSLPARRQALAGTILTLEREQGAALLDGKPVDMAPLIAARDELSALDMAEAEAARRNREAKAAQIGKASAEAIKDLEDHLASFLGALTASQGHVSALVKELQRIEALRADMVVLLRKIGAQVPDVLSRPECRTVLSRLIAAEFNALGENSRFGVMRWNSVQPVADWSDHVAKHLVPAIEHRKENENA